MVFPRAKDPVRDPIRITVAKYLEANGPTAGNELAEAVGLTLERFWVVINHPWFEITGKGWDLTAQGRGEAVA